MSRKYSSPLYELDVPWWVYDLAIVVALTLLGVTHVWAHLHAGALVLVVRLLSGAAFSLIVYGSFIEPRLLAVRRYDIGKGGRSVRVAFLSDIHVGPYKGTAWVRRLVKTTNALAPDVVLIGGDLLYRDGKDVTSLEPLKGLRAALGVYAILGNHDEHRAAAEAKAWFEHSGIPLLLNRGARVEKDGAEIIVAGADDDWYGETNLETAFKDIQPNDLAIVMLHNPDLAPPAAKLLKDRAGQTVFFCGHTHGGQIRLPFIGSVWKIPHHLGRKYDRGLFDFDGIPLVIGAGAGESGPRARLFCPPEIVLATLRF